MLDLKIRVAGKSDLSAIREFVAVHFHDDKEPLETSHVDKVDKMKPDDSFLLDCIDSEATLLGFDGDKLVSVLLAGKILPNDAERNFECAKHVASKKAADILRFLSYIEAKADYCNRLKVSQCLHVHIITVISSYQRQGIAKQLFKRCFEIGREKNFPAITVSCSSFFTEKIAENLKFTCISTTTYDEYNSHVGEKLFIPNQPHIEIKSYAKFYDEKL